MRGICIDGIRAALARKAECARCANAWKCNELTGSEEPEEDERAAEEDAEEEIEEVTETISQPDRGARRNAETTEAIDPTHSAVRKG